MAATARGTAIREVNLTTARNLSPIFDEAVRKERPIVIVRGGRERGLLLAREAMLRVLAPFRLHVDVLPEDDGGYTLWLNELNVGGAGRSLREARQALLSTVQSFATNYIHQFGFYRHLPDMARLEPYVLRLALAQDDAELIEMIFGASSTDEEPTAKAPTSRA